MAPRRVQRQAFVVILDVSLVADEWPMLVLRALTLKDVVDHTVIVRCRTTHQGEWADLQPVPAWVREQIPNLVEYRFDPDLARVAKDGTVYQRPIGERGGASTPWFAHIERQHRDYCAVAARTVTDDPDAIVMVSDVDEMPEPAEVASLRDFSAFWLDFPDHTIGWWTFAQRFHSTALDLLVPHQPWLGTCVTRLAELDPQAQRDARTTVYDEHPTCSVIEMGGWHLSTMGTDEERRRKVETFSHAEHRDWDGVKARAERTHISGEQLSPCEFPGTFDWPAPLLDGTFTIPESWRV